MDQELGHVVPEWDLARGPTQGEIVAESFATAVAEFFVLVNRLAFHCPGAVSNAQPGNRWRVGFESHRHPRPCQTERFAPCKHERTYIHQKLYFRIGVRARTGAINHDVLTLLPGGSSADRLRSSSLPQMGPDACQYPFKFQRRG